MQRIAGTWRARVFPVEFGHVVTLRGGGVGKQQLWGTKQLFLLSKAKLGTSSANKLERSTITVICK